ncbi:MAG: glycosyltransferase family 2 protein [Bacteroidales bacterium]|nr:glycosyltransferase family 2 protein [Bacteroidales bacterium]
MTHNQQLSIIVPCYNEEETVALFVAETDRQTVDLPLELVYYFIDDGSSDGTLEAIKELSRQHPRIKYLSFSRNFGKEAALLAGLQAAKGDFIAVMDADLQDPPELLKQMYDEIQKGYDIVGARRTNRKSEPPIRSFFAKQFYKLINQISETEMVDGVRDFRMMTRQVVDAVLSLEEVNRFSKGLFSWVGFKTSYISYENRERVAGTTSWHFWGLVKYSIEGIVNFSETPLNIATFIGFITFIGSIFLGLFYVIKAFAIGDPVPGFPTLITILLFFGGLQLFCLGILGKYIAKIFLESKRRPVYIVREKNV